jgi:hypothetical protein
VTNLAPVVLDVVPRLVTDTNGLALGTLVQLSLSRAGLVNFGLVDVGGQLVSMPWDLIVSGLATNGATNIQDVVQKPPPVLMGLGSFPPEMDAEFQNRILSYVAEQMRPAVNRGGSAGAGVTITGGDTNVASFNTTFAATATNSGRTTNYAASNSATNTTNGVPSPTGRTNGVHIPPLPGRQQR